jgi:hypothetical protein
MRRLVASRPVPGAGCSGSVAGVGTRGEAAKHEHMREIKNQIMGNRTKKLLYLCLGAMSAVVAATLVQAVAAAWSFACGVGDGTRAVLDTGAVGHLSRLLTHFDEEVGSGTFTCSFLVFAGIWMVLGLKMGLFCVFLA